MALNYDNLLHLAQDFTDGPNASVEREVQLLEDEDIDLTGFTFPETVALLCFTLTAWSDRTRMDNEVTRSARRKFTDRYGAILCGPTMRIKLTDALLARISEAHF